MNRAAILAGCAAWAIARSASGQSFPGDSKWTPLPCGPVVMFDGYRDEATALNERDVVGDSRAAAGFRAFDEHYLYLRLRLDQDPAPGGAPRPFSWGFELDLDRDPTTYELLIAVNGGTDEVALARNTSTSSQNDPTDPADSPPVATYPFSSHGRSVAAAGSSFGSDGDFFLDMAVPWSDLLPIGLTPSTPILAWAASSSTAIALNGDFACHDGATGRPTLTGIPTARTTIDPTFAPDGGVPSGDGGGGGTTGPLAFEGGPGCSVGGRAPSRSGLLAAILAGCLLGLRRRPNAARRGARQTTPA